MLILQCLLGFDIVYFRRNVEESAVFVSPLLHVVEAADSSEALLPVGQFNGFTFQKSEMLRVN
jgi:hypothetical protein